MADNKPAGRKPDYMVSALDKETGRKASRIGAAWINPDGSISVKLDFCVVLNAANDNLVVTLFPNDRDERPPY